MTFKVNIIDSNSNSHTEIVEENSFIVGKSRECKIKLDGWRVGREHTRVFRTSAGIFVQDLGQFHGTYVNGARVAQHGPLSANEEIAIGNYKLTVVDNPTASPVQNIPAQKSMIDFDEKPLSRGQVKQNNSSHQAWRTRIHEQLLETIDLRRRDILRMEDQELRVETETLIREIVAREKARSKSDNTNSIFGTAKDKRKTQRVMTSADYEKIIQDVLSEAVGLGPLEELLADDSISEIMVNRYDEIFVERSGNLELHHTTFTSDRAVLGVIERIVAPIGRRIDESSPMVDARLKDGSRVNAIISPLALKGPSLTIRKFSRRALSVQDLISFGSLSRDMANFIKICVLNKKSMVISGGTGSGKTTLLNVLSSFIPDNERIVTIEDAAELKLVQPNLVSLEARPANAEGRGEVSIRNLVKNSLRMRPDRIVVGECRGGEALDMLQVMNTGHEGSLTTLHANNPRDALARLETLTLMAGMELPLAAIREQIASAVDIVIQQTRLPDGQRKVTSIVEITGIESTKIQMQEIFRFAQTGRGNKGEVEGKFVGCDAVPSFYEALREIDPTLDISIFQTGGRI